LRLPGRVIRLVQVVLHSGSRVADRLFGTELSLYGWAMYLTPEGGDPVELPGYANVCLHCGSGHPLGEIKRIRRVCYRCPACNRVNPYFPPFGNRV
jgi:hypothetical protein